MSKTFYTCDKKACGKDYNCGPCEHTSKAEHAINFEKQGNHFFEKRGAIKKTESEEEERSR